MLPYINDFPIEFRDYIASEIIPRYAGFDKAHRVDHVLKVIAESLNLSQYYDVSRNGLSAAQRLCTASGS